MEMTGSGKHGKRSSGFPPFPLPLEIALRFLHSPRRDHSGHIFTLPFTDRSIEHEL
jgi:hypothetical protein